MSLVSDLDGGHLILDRDRVTVRTMVGARHFAASDDADAVRTLSIFLYDDNSPAAAAAAWSAVRPRCARLRRLEISSSGAMDGELAATVPASIQELALYTMRWDDSAYDAIARCHQLRALTVMHYKLDVAKLRQCAPQLEELLLENVGDVDVDEIAAFTSVRRLHLRYIKTLGKQAMKLTVMSALTELDLSGTGVDDPTGAKLVTQLPLRTFRVSGTKIGAKTSKAIALSQTLEEVDVSQCKMASIDSIAACSQLRVLDVVGTRARPTDLGTATHLRDLHVFCLEPGLLRVAAQLPALRTLRVEGGVIGEPEGELSLEEVQLKYVQDPSTSAIAACLQPTLRRARIVRVPLPEQLVRERAPHLRQLQELDVHTTTTNLAALAAIDSLRRLYSIDNLTDAGIAAFARMPHLRELSLQDEGLSGADICTLAASRSLRSLHVSGVSLTEAEGRALASAPHLRTLHVEGLRPAMLDQLSASLPNCFVRG